MSLPRIKTLAETIKKNGYEYRLVKKNTDKAMYSQHLGTGNIVAYEVFKLRYSKPHPKAEEDIKNYDKVERFPNDEDFGKTAWTYSKLTDAEKAFECK